MDAEVIPLFPKAKRRLDYYCMRCDNNSFRLQADGEIYCESCGSKMVNLYVSVYPPERA